jgi:hypothetical protein
MARNFQAGAAWILGVIVQQLGPVTYLIEVSDGRLWKRHIDHVKRYVSQGPPMEADGMEEPNIPLPSPETPELGQVPIPEAVEQQEPEIQSEALSNAAPPHAEAQIPKN